MENGVSCSKEECEFIVEKRYYKRGKVRQPGSVKKIICSARSAKGEQLLSLITYASRKTSWIVKDDRNLVPKDVPQYAREN